MSFGSQPAYFRPDWIVTTSERLRVDVCVYGATAGGVIAAVTAARRGRSVVLLQPGRHIGGMTTGGLGWTDYGRKHVIGGASRRFYRDLGRHYGVAEEWRFFPQHATATLQGYLDDADITPRLAQYLEAVEMEGTRLREITMLGGLRVEAKQFIDATYEGDLMAAAGVAFHVGREANDRYGEQLNGVQVFDTHNFHGAVDPYRDEGDPASGLLPGIIDVDLSRHLGEGDSRLQAYNFRVCMTDDPALKIDWDKPAGFDPDEYVLLTRWLNSDIGTYNEPLKGDVWSKFDVLPHPTPGGYRKTDTNNHGAVSSDFIGRNYAWPNAGYAARERLFQQHVTYQQGLYWHVANAPGIPDRYRDAMDVWGLPRDEFEDTGHWPHQLYVREARRMIGDVVLTEADCRGERVTDRPIGMASYTMDSHNCTRFVQVVDGVARVLNEGDVQVPPTAPYPIDYRAVVPRAGQASNLFVPVCLSSSHIAFGSARMEPVFMVLGESVAIAADLCIGEGCAVQDLPYPSLRGELDAAGQVLALRDGEQAG